MADHKAHWVSHQNARLADQVFRGNWLPLDLGLLTTYAKGTAKNLSYKSSQANLTAVLNILNSCNIWMTKELPWPLRLLQVLLLVQHDSSCETSLVLLHFCKFSLECGIPITQWSQVDGFKFLNSTSCLPFLQLWAGYLNSQNFHCLICSSIHTFWFNKYWWNTAFRARPGEINT